MAKRWSVEKLQQEALKRDISFHAHQWFTDEHGHIRDPRVVEVVRRGHESEAANWLKSMTEDGMKYGDFTREERLESAKKHARLAKKMLPAIAIEHGLGHVLNINPAT